MKIIIDIPEDVYTRLFDSGIQDNEISLDDICEMARSLRRGTPIPDNATVCDIEQIRAEIEKEMQECKEVDDRYGAFVIEKILNIFDERTKGDAG